MEIPFLNRSWESHTAVYKNHAGPIAVKSDVKEFFVGLDRVSQVTGAQTSSLPLILGREEV